MEGKISPGQSLRLEERRGFKSTRALQYLEGGREGETCIANRVVGYDKKKRQEKSQKVSLGPTA